MTENVVYASIDIGYSGAIAKFLNGELLNIWDMPICVGRTGKKQLDYQKLIEILGHHIAAAYSHGTVYVEYVAAMPGQGVTSMFNFGVQVGAVRGILETLGRDVRLITPTVWKRHLGLVGQEKEASRLLALEKFPRHTEFFKRKKDHGRADAALIGLVGYELNAAGKTDWLK